MESGKDEEKNYPEEPDDNRVKVKKSNSFKTFSNIGMKLFTKYRKTQDQNSTGTIEETQERVQRKERNSIFRRPSWRKFTNQLNKFAQQVTSVNVSRPFLYKYIAFIAYIPDNTCTVLYCAI